MVERHRFGSLGRGNSNPDCLVRGGVRRPGYLLACFMSCLLRQSFGGVQVSPAREPVRISFPYLDCLSTSPVLKEIPDCTAASRREQAELPLARFAVRPQELQQRGGVRRMI